MYQLSHLLSEQKSLLASLSNSSVLGDEKLLVSDDGNNNDKEETEDENRQKISAIVEKVEGCSVSLLICLCLLQIRNRLYLGNSRCSRTNTVA